MSKYLIFKVTLTLFIFCTPNAMAVDANGRNTNEKTADYYLQKGELSKGERELKELSAMEPDNQNLRFELGAVQFMQAVEHLGQELYRYGSSSRAQAIPFIRFPVPDNPDPDPVTYEDVRNILETFIRDLDKADETLAGVTNPDVKIKLHLFKFKMDINGDGEVDADEDLSAVYARYFSINEQMARQFKNRAVHFDLADAHWMRGYCSLLRGLCDFILAYDQRAIWDVTALRLFPEAQVRFDFLMEEAAKGDYDADDWWDVRPITDMIAGIHNMNMPLKDADRVLRSRDHLLGMIEQSRLMWQAIDAETDDDNEWIPGPDQSAALTRFRITENMVETWHDFLNEGERVLNGELLVPFWRGTNERRGVNIGKAFEQPRPFDLVLWIQGSAAAPYLEEGELTTPETWMRFQEVFRGEFFSFAIWVN